MENSDAPGVRGEPGGHRASGRGRDSPDAHFFFADESTNVPVVKRRTILIPPGYTQRDCVWRQKLESSRGPRYTMTRYLAGD